MEGPSHINVKNGEQPCILPGESRKDGYPVGCEAGISSSREGQEAWRGKCCGGKTRALLGRPEQKGGQAPQGG